MLRHWSRSVWWCKRELMLQLWNHKTKTVTVTQNLVLELKYDTVNKKNDNALPSRAGHWDLHLPNWVSSLSQAVGQSLLSYPGTPLGGLDQNEKNGARLGQRTWPLSQNICSETQFKIQHINDEMKKKCYNPYTWNNSWLPWSWPLYLII